MNPSSSSDDKWLPGTRSAVGARMRLFCFPYAGGSFTAFKGWQTELTNEIEVRPVELPGRLSRLREPPFRDMSTLLDALMRALAPHIEEPFALFGYSMGALIAFELARRFARDNRRMPSHVFVAARPAPQLPQPTVQLSKLSDVVFLEEIQHRYRRIPEPVLHDPGMRTAVLNMMRADLELIENYTFKNGPALRCPLTALGGTADPLVDRKALAAWSDLTAGGFELCTFNGDHFFLETHREAVLRTMRWKLAISSC